MNLKSRWQRIMPESITLTELHAYATERGYIDDTFAQFRRKYIDQRQKYTHLKKNLQEVVMCGQRTFGSYEPTYLELLGPSEILRFRYLTAPRCLLLGSLGYYSASEFANFLKKLNPSARVYVIDEWDESVNIIAQETKRDELLLVRGDATQLPFADGSFTHVYTNFLFHALGGMNASRNYAHMLGHKVFSEVARVLEQGGSFLFVESPVRTLRRNSALLRFGYRQAAIKHGFHSTLPRLRPISYILTPEKMKAEVGSDGYGRCSGVALEQYRVDVAYRFIK